MRLNVEHRIDNDCSRTGSRKQRKQDRLRETSVALDTHTRAMDSPALEVDPARGGGDIIGACMNLHLAFPEEGSKAVQGGPVPVRGGTALLGWSSSARALVGAC